MKKAIRGTALILAAVLAAGCAGSGPRTLSDKYVKVTDYIGVEIERATTDEVTEEDIDTVIEHMMGNYVQEHDLPADTAITDEIVKEFTSGGATTVEQYRKEIRSQIQASKDKAVKEEEELRVWEKVIDNSEVKEYPKDRMKEIKDDLVELYESYAAQDQKEYDEYMEAIGLTDEDLDEAAEASLKQELVAEVIADYYGLKPTEEAFQEALEAYAKEFQFTTVDLLLSQVPEEDMRRMVIQDNVRAWLRERCTYAESDGPGEDADEKDNEKTDEKDSENIEQEELEKAADGNAEE